MKRTIIVGLALLLATRFAVADIEYIASKKLPALGPYSPATALQTLVFTSGQIAFDPKQNKVIDGDISAQTRQALDNLRAVLATSGSSFDRILRITVYLKNPSDFAAMNKVYAEYFPTNKPARTTVPGVAWGPGVLIEVDAIAARKLK